MQNRLVTKFMAGNVRLPHCMCRYIIALLRVAAFQLLEITMEAYGLKYVSIIIIISAILK